MITAGVAVEVFVIAADGEVLEGEGLERAAVEAFELVFGVRASADHFEVHQLLLVAFDAADAPDRVDDVLDEVALLAVKP